MKQLKHMMNEVERKRCIKCPYLDNTIAIEQKPVIASCMTKGLEQMAECEIYMHTLRLKNRIRYLKGEIGPLFMHTKDKQLMIDCFDLEE